MTPALPFESFETTVESPTPELRRGALARMAAERLTPTRVALVEEALRAFDPDSYALLVEL